MPMDFPDMKSLIRAAEVHKFRQIRGDETSEEYRIALSDHVINCDSIEGCEIRFGVGWDKWTDEQKHESMLIIMTMKRKG